MSGVAATTLELLGAFSTALTKNFAAAGVNPAQAEDQLKAPTVALFDGLGSLLGKQVVARTEATAKGVRPDIGVSVDGLLAGHVELKAPGKGARPSAFTDQHDKNQFKVLSAHPNLLYTDGNEWALYREGQLTGKVVRSVGDVCSAGDQAFGAAEAVELEALFRDFLGWQPLVPSTPGALAHVLAPLTRLLREAVLVVLQRDDSALSQLAHEWRTVLFADADDARFADAYAQTVTYALLLARVEGESDLRGHAADRLDKRHGLLAQVLRVLAQKEAREEVDVQVSLLERAIGAVDPVKLQKRGGADLWLYFYEDFLSAYDTRLRRQTGVYYTPPEVVEAQVALVAEMLREEFDRELGFADDDVVVLDPGVGTGTYLLAALDSGADTAFAAQGEGGRAERTNLMARNFYGFEILVGPYAVAQLRVAQRVIANGGQVPDEGLQIILTDTLESPYGGDETKGNIPLFEKRLAEENARARKVKAETPVLVCLGNPPYFRQVIDPDDEGVVERLGGWVRRRDDDSPGILQDFLRDTPGVHAKNLYNLYVYFWRWALWKVFESGDRKGVVSFITASSYLRGPGFAGMRRHMREVFDELWIIDLGGEGRGARQEENVFAIRTPVAIAVGYRRGESDTTTPAAVRYTRVRGTREEKLAVLRKVASLDDLAWADCFDGWTQPFTPPSAGNYFDWPALTDIFPWQHSGVEMKRTWPIAASRDVLASRWARLLSADDRRRAFHETRDRRIDQTYAPLASEGRLPALASVPKGTDPPTAVRYPYRSLDRQYVLADSRLGDFLRPALWRTSGARQIYLTSLLTSVLGPGPAAMATYAVPDRHHFRGSFGGKDVIPLWRDALGTQANVTSALLDALPESASPEDLMAYCYAILQSPTYTVRFAEELEVPGPRVPLTEDPDLWRRGVELGRELVWLHTYGERFVPTGGRAGKVPPGAAKYTAPVPATQDGYPRRHWYEAETQELHVGEGVFAPVSPAVRAFSVSGLDVVGSWLDYRMRDGAGRKSSPLDDIRPETWPAQFSTELLELLWVIEHTVALHPKLDGLLDEIVGGPTIPASALPQPTEEERLAPG